MSITGVSGIVLYMDNDYLKNLNTKEDARNDWVPDTTLFWGTKIRNTFVGAVNICHYLDDKRLWDKGGKAWKYEYKYRRGGKTLCALYARENCVGFMIILGEDERLKFEADRESYSKEVQEIYDETKTYHDGKWIMFEPADTSLFHDFIRLLQIKRKANRK